MVEKWKQVKNFPNYWVSDLGKIKNIVTGRLLTLSRNKGGYYHIVLCKNKTPYTKYIHRLVLQAFDSSYSDNLTCNHKNGIKSDNRIENLEMVTQGENNKHAFKVKLRNNIGENNPNTKLKNYQVRLIKKILYYKNLNMPKITYRGIGFLFNASEYTIYRINSNKDWKYT